MNETMRQMLSGLDKHLDLGHSARDEAFLRNLCAMCESPGTPPTQVAGKTDRKQAIAAAVSFYRLADNDDVSLSALRSTRAGAALEGHPDGADLMLIHDMSPLDYSGHNSKKDRRKIGNHRGMGYEYICCLAVNPHGGELLGVLHDTVVNASGPDDCDHMDYECEPALCDFSATEKKRLRDNHRHQMAVHVNGTASSLSRWHVIDVADREFDDVFILDRCRQKGRDFVIRSSGSRNVQTPDYSWLPARAHARKQGGHALEPGWVCSNMADIIKHVPLMPYKSVAVDKRNRVADPSLAHRQAELSMGVFKMRLYRRAKRNKKYVATPRPVEVNVVVLIETAPPAGAKPVRWILLTSLAIDTREQMLYVAHLYELRWRIEEFFRLLKSGYHILKSRLDNAQKIARYLVMITIAAMTIVNLKRSVGLGSGGRLNDEQYGQVKAAMIEPENHNIALELRLLALIAKQGGWLGRRRDPIGPQILMRGLLQLLATLHALTQYRSLLEEALRNPQALLRLIRV